MFSAVIMKTNYQLVNVTINSFCTKTKTTAMKDTTRKLLLLLF
jgi:hypothetical protein